MQNAVRSLTGRSLLLLAALLLAAVVVCPLAATVGGRMGLAACGAAWLTCVVAGLLALLPTLIFSSPRLVLPQVGCAMAARVGLPLAACLVVYGIGGALASGGFVYYLLAFYFVMLSVETVIMVAAVSQPPRPTEAG